MQTRIARALAVSLALVLGGMVVYAAQVSSRPAAVPPTESPPVPSPPEPPADPVFLPSTKAAPPPLQPIPQQQQAPAP